VRVREGVRKDGGGKKEFQLLVHTIIIYNIALDYSRHKVHYALSEKKRQGQNSFVLLNENIT